MSDVINGVPRELLERSAEILDDHGSRTALELRALLTAQPQASAATCEQCGGSGSDSGRTHPDGQYEAYKCEACDGFGTEQASAAQSAPDLQCLESVLDDVCGTIGGTWPTVGPVYSISLAEVAEAFRRMTAKSAPAGEREAMDAAFHSSGLTKFKDTYAAGWEARAAWQRTQSAAVPGMRHTDQWESARVADYNAGWNDRHTADFSRLSDEQIFDIAEPFGEFRYGDAQGDKRIAFARAIIAALAAAPAQPAAQETCQTCNGVGIVGHSELCPECKGAPQPAAQDQGEVQRLRGADGGRNE